VYTALAGNVAVAVAKFVAYGLSGSSAMFTEAIHSLVDSIDQILLLIGQHRGRRPPDAGHPLGHGMEGYFWSLIVAVMVLLLGGFASLYQGVRHVIAPEPLASPAISFGVLAAAAIFEGGSLLVGLREYRRIIRGRDVSLWRFIRLSKDPSLYASLLEDSAALVGISIAAIGLIAATVFHIDRADGIASVAIGILLVGIAGVLANETRSLITGEAVAPPVLEELRRLLDADARVADVHDIATMHLGPHSILVALTITFNSDLRLDALRDAIRELTAEMQKADERISYVYVRPALD
jgi:cation diffusion facilitator family transporter